MQISGLKKSSILFRLALFYLEEIPENNSCYLCSMENNFDIIVVGAGHAGCEAAAAAANMGSRVLLVTMDMTKVAQMSCNPAMGGIAKGQIVREVDALGGYSGWVTDASTLQFRMLNRSKGPAMWSPRAQCDLSVFSLTWRKLLEDTPNLYFWQDSVNALLLEDKKVVGISTVLGAVFRAKAVVLTNGTFLNGIIHIGKTQITGGRMGDAASYGLSEQLRNLGFEVGRMKTGTPARLDGRTIDFSKLIRQDGDAPSSKFSYFDNPAILKNVPRGTNGAATPLPCYIAHSSKKVHDILREGFADSPLFSGTIKGIGPRYCPSIEDKLRTFADKDSHQLFLEPEGWNTHEYYIQGFSSSLPMDIQFRAMREVEGLERVEFLRPGYAIEYDYFPPIQLRHSLETKLLENLYFAGQINGTTGYEEAAAQGLMAGINAHLKISGKPEFILRRDQAYIGVLIDDLVTKGVDEPYRMFTSRAEYRILLRQDNADMRLTELSYGIGLASEERYAALLEKKKQVDSLLHYLKHTSVRPEEINPFLERMGSTPIPQSKKIVDVLMRPEVFLTDLVKVLPIIENVPRGTSGSALGVWPVENEGLEQGRACGQAGGLASVEVLAEVAEQQACPDGFASSRSAADGGVALTASVDVVSSAGPGIAGAAIIKEGGEVNEETLEAAEILLKYSGYIERERALADKVLRLEDVRIPRAFDFDRLSSVSIEGRQKLKRYQPETIGQASRIAGISPADISVMLVFFGR